MTVVLGRPVFDRYVVLRPHPVPSRIQEYQSGSKYYDSPSMCQALFQTPRKQL